MGCVRSTGYTLRVYVCFVETALVPAAPQAVVVHFARHQRLTVRQRKRWIEILLSFEMKNAYDVFDEDGMPVVRVEEQGKGMGSFFKRLLMGPLRWFTANVNDLSTQSVLLSLRRPFRFFFHRLEVSGPGGEKIGAIQRRWSWVRRIYTVEDAEGKQVASLFGPVFRPWTFEIRLANETSPVGLLQKKWSGFAKEMFTDADNFGIDLSGVQDPTLKSLLFSATVLVDVVHFERAKG
jgi:uncharacterized protein YxjI